MWSCCRARNPLGGCICDPFTPDMWMECFHCQFGANTMAFNVGSCVSLIQVYQISMDIRSRLTRETYQSITWRGCTVAKCAIYLCVSVFQCKTALCTFHSVFGVISCQPWSAPWWHNMLHYRLWKAPQSKMLDIWWVRNKWYFSFKVKWVNG